MMFSRSEKLFLLGYVHTEMICTNWNTPYVVKLMCPLIDSLFNIAVAEWWRRSKLKAPPLARSRTRGSPRRGHLPGVEKLTLSWKRSQRTDHWQHQCRNKQQLWRPEGERARQFSLPTATFLDRGKRSESLLFSCYLCFCWIPGGCEGSIEVVEVPASDALFKYPGKLNQQAWPSLKGTGPNFNCDYWECKS